MNYEAEYIQAWDNLQNAKTAYEIARRNFHEVSGLMLEQLMLDNVDVLVRLKTGDIPTI